MVGSPDAALKFATETDNTFPFLCDHFVGRAYGLAHSGYKNAWAHWLDTPEKYRNPGKDAPVGSLVFWSNKVGKGHGHVAIVTGQTKDGEPIVTSTHSNGGQPTEFRLSQVMPGAYVGWSAPYFHGKVADLSSLDVNKGKLAVSGQQDMTLYGQQPDKLKMKDLRRDYGIAAGILDDNPDLKDVFKEIIANNITDPTRQLALLRETNWFQKHTTEWMAVEKARQEKDPRIWNALVDQRAEQVRLSFEGAGAEISTEEARKYAKQLMYGSGWNGGDFEIYDEKWLRGKIAKAIDFTKTKTVNGVVMSDLTGAAADYATKLYDTAYQYGVNASMTDSGFAGWFGKTMEGLIGGSMTEEQIDDELRQQAMSRFPGLSQQIQRGLTVRQAADPYLRAIGDALEMDPSTLDLNDNMVQRVLNVTDESGQFKPLSIYDTKLMARKDERWQFTSTAKREYTDMASKILRDFGFLG